MASEQVIENEVIAKAVAEVTRAAVQTMAAAMAERPQSKVGPKIGRPAMKQPSFNWKADDKYSRLKTFSLEVSNIFTMYSTPQAEQLAIVKNWLGRKGMQFIVIDTYKKDTCNALEALFEMLTNKFKPQFNKMIKSLQFHKLSRENGENAEEWMGRLQLFAIECNCKELEQFIHVINDTDN